MLLCSAITPFDGAANIEPKPELTENIVDKRGSTPAKRWQDRAPDIDMCRSELALGAATLEQHYGGRAAISVTDVDRRNARARGSLLSQSVFQLFRASSETIFALFGALRTVQNSRSFARSAISAALIWEDAAVCCPTQRSSSLR